MAFRFEVFGDFACESFGGAGLRSIEHGDLERGRWVGDVTGGGGGEEASEKTVEPAALLGREGRVVGDEGGQSAWLGVLLRVAERLEFGDRVAAGEDEEGFFGFAMLGVGGEEALHFGGKFGEGMAGMSSRARP